LETDADVIAEEMLPQTLESGQDQKEASVDDLTEDLQPEEIHQIHSLHRSMHEFMDQRQRHWIPLNAGVQGSIEDVTGDDFVDVLQASYSVSANLMKLIEHESPSRLDDIALGGHVVMMDHLAKELSARPNDLRLHQSVDAEAEKRRQRTRMRKKGSRVTNELLDDTNRFVKTSSLDAHSVPLGELVYDIYRDPNIGEVLLVREPVQSLSTRLVELLIEFPGHPILEQLLRTCRRLLSFSITSPLMKVLVGVEFLHSKVNDWQMTASKRVSLQQHYDTLARLITRWRKLELSSWPLLFYTRLQGHRIAAEKWWLHLYSLLRSQDIGTTASQLPRIVARPTTADTQSTTASTGIEQPKDLLLETLDGFMQTSNFGEFAVRLDLLRTFHHQLAAELACEFVRDESAGMDLDTRRHLCNLVYNVYQYYNQFSDTVRETLKRDRTPLEKKVRDFIQLARWDDVNYYALKTSAEKSHRKLNKFTRQLEDLLKNPVRPLLDVKPVQQAQQQQQPIEVATGVTATPKKATAAGKAKPIGLPFDADNVDLFIAKDIVAPTIKPDDVPVQLRPAFDLGTPILNFIFHCTR
jgi:midasin (ATPase involved in ribosome maturation)